MKKFIIALLLLTSPLILFAITRDPAHAQGNTWQVHLPLITKAFDPAWHWDDPMMVTLETKPNTSDAMPMLIDQDGFPHIWWDTFYSPRYIYHTHLTAQGWISPTYVAETLGTSETMFVPVQDSHGTIHLLWYNWLGTGVENAYRLMYANYDNEQWSPEETAVQSEYARQGMIHLDAQDNLYVTHVSAAFFSDIQQTRRSDIGWTTSTDIDPSHSVRLVWPDMDGGVHLYGEISYPDQQVLYSYWKNGQFLIDGRVIPGDLPTGDSQLDGLNNLHLFRWASVPVPGDTVYGIYHRCLTNDLAWTDEQVLSGYQDVRSTLQKASDQVSRVALVWQETSGNLVHVAVFEDCTLIHSATTTLPQGSDWELDSAAISRSPYKMCFLARKLYTSTEFLVQCATIDR